MNTKKVDQGLFFFLLSFFHIFFDIDYFSFCGLFGTSLCSGG